MHEHGCLHFHIQNKNLYKTGQKKLIVPFEKKVDYHVLKTKLKNKYCINSNCSAFKTILYEK
jgi:hypothetical protein